MARKINVKLILELREFGMSRSMISSSRGISRNSIREVFSIADEKQIAYSDVADKSDDEVYRLFYPQKYAYEIIYGDPDYAYVHEELKKTGVTLKTNGSSMISAKRKSSLSLSYLNGASIRPLLSFVRCIAQKTG